jgi:Nif-specific regulatory protein
MVDAPLVSRLVVIGGAFTGEVFALDSAEVTFGRDTSNTIGIPDAALSRRHCVFGRDPAGWTVRDLGSSNGTFVNGVQVQNQLLVEGDRVAAGGSVLLYVRSARPGMSAVDLDENDALPVTATLALDDAAYLRRADSTRTEPARTEQGLRALLAISTVINAIRDEAQLHHELLDLLFETVPAEEGAILRIGPDGEMMVQTARPAPEGGAFHVPAALVRRAHAEGAGIMCVDARSEVAACGTARSRMAVPMGIGGRTLGAIYLITPVGRLFVEDHLQLVTAVARIAATALENVRHVAALERETDRLQSDLHLAHQMIGTSAPVRQVYDRIGKVARVDTTALITGETGTGKELAARAIHLNSSRSRRAFIAINCAALTESLLESELFGHERGAFTHAIAQKKGKLELADGGTAFLDEVGELAPALQSKLLRVLQEHEFERVGGTRPIKVDLRILSATNRDLPADVAAGRFRRDLYYRLNVVSIHLPPLRERRDDLPLLAQHFLSVYARKSGRRVTRISAAAMRSLLAYDWPGNVRELENAIERAVVLGSTEEILLEDLPESLIESAAPSAPNSDGLHATIVDAKRRAVIAAFRKAGGSYTEAAKLLGVHPNYLHRLIRNLDIKGTLENAGV